MDDFEPIPLSDEAQKRILDTTFDHIMAEKRTDREILVEMFKRAKLDFCQVPKGPPYAQINVLHPSQVEFPDDRYEGITCFTFNEDGSLEDVVGSDY